MRIGPFLWCTCACLVLTTLPAPAGAQIYEAVGTRAQGMGGAFVAVANDSSATWWNPAGLADGPFLDMALAHATTEGGPSEDRATWFALGTPPFGFSYYRVRLTRQAPASPTVDPEGGRQDRGAGIPTASLSSSHLGVTLLHTIVSGVHAGTTVRYVSGSVDEGDGEHGADIDLGLLAVAGPLRLGIAARNLAEPDFGGGTVVLPRQVRAGVAFDASRLPGPALTIALDADLRRYAAGADERRVVAVGVERWVRARRIGLRAGARFNTVGREERSVTAGLSVSPRAGLFLEGFAVRGGAIDEEGWGLAARVSF